jgi:hypothetical protein
MKEENFFLDAIFKFPVTLPKEPFYLLLAGTIPFNEKPILSKKRTLKLH